MLSMNSIWSQNTTQKSISIAFCVSSIRHDSSLSKYRKQKQSPPGRAPFLVFPGGGLLLFTVLAEWRIMTNRAYAKSNGDGLLCSILWYGRVNIFNYSIWCFIVADVPNSHCFTAMGMEPATFGLLVQHTTNRAVANGGVWGVWHPPWKQVVGKWRDLSANEK
jgi:hypothetical protein